MISPTASQFTVVYPPWWSATQAFRAAAADASILGGGRFGLVVVRLDPTIANPRDFAKIRARLRAGGALLFLNLAASICGSKAA